MSRRPALLLYWSPRVLTIVLAVFLSLFALDAFNGVQGFWPVAKELSIHLIPATVVVLALVAAWRWEWVGAGLFTLLAGLYMWEVLPRHVDWAVTIALPLLAIAALFLLNWIERAKVRDACFKSI